MKKANKRHNKYFSRRRKYNGSDVIFEEITGICLELLQVTSPQIQEVKWGMVETVGAHQISHVLSYISQTVLSLGWGHVDYFWLKLIPGQGSWRTMPSCRRRPDGLGMQLFPFSELSHYPSLGITCGQRLLPCPHYSHCPGAARTH